MASSRKSSVNEAIELVHVDKVKEKEPPLSSKRNKKKSDVNVETGGRASGSWSSAKNSSRATDDGLEILV